MTRVRGTRPLNNARGLWPDAAPFTVETSSMNRLSLLMCYLALAAVAAVFSACGGGSSPAPGGGAATTPATFLLTDAPVDELSVFQVEVTGVDLIPTSGAASVQVFPVKVGQTLTVNLLNLQGVNALLSAASIPTGSYSSIELTYSNATAVDRLSNPLAVLPSTSGSILMNMVPKLTVGATPVSVQIDFDVNASISNLFTGTGGSLTLNPMVFAVQQGAGGPALSVQNLIGTVQSVGTQSLVVDGPAGAVAVTITAATRVVVGTVISTGITDLSTVLAVNQLVDVRGTLNAQGIAAKEIEVRGLPAQGGGAAVAGQQFEAIVVAVGTATAEVRVQDSNTTTLAPGTSQTVTLSASTVYGYENPVAAAGLSNLTPGQRVRIFGTSASALDAQRVSLKDTKLTGTVVSTDAVNLQASVTAASVGGLAVSGIANFTNPVTVQFTGAIPAGLAANGAFEASGVFSRSAPGVFDAVSAVAAAAREAEIEGYTYAVTSSSPLQFTLTGEGERLGLPNPATVTVELATGARVFERNKATRVVTPITEAALAAGLAAASYGEIKAKGSFSNGTLTAREVRVDTGTAGAGESEIEGSVYAVVAASPLEFTITGDGRRLGVTGSTTATVVLAANAVLGLKTPFSAALSPLTVAELTLGLQNNGYHEVEAKGTWNVSTQTLTATFVKAELAEDEVEGSAYTVTASSPLAFELTGVGMVGGAAFTGTVSVVLTPDATIVERGADSSDYAPILPAALATGLGNAAFDEVKLKGSYDPQTQVFTASEIRVRIR